MKIGKILLISSAILGGWVLLNLFNFSIDIPLSGGYISKGDYYAKCQKAVFAIKEYEKAIQADPNSFEAHFKLGSMYQELGEKDKALQEFGVAAKLAKRSIRNTYDVEIALASILIAEKHFEEAVQKLTPYATDSRKIAKKLAEIYVEWGRDLYNDQKKVQAIDKYKEALKLLGDIDPEEQVVVEELIVNAYKSIAEDYAWEKDPNKAIDLLVKSLEQVYSPVTLNKIGALYEKQGKFKNAIDYYKKAYQSNSVIGSASLSQLLLKEAEAYAAKDDYAKARQLYKEAKEVNDSINIPLKVMYPIKIDKVIASWSRNNNSISMEPRVSVTLTNKGDEAVNFIKIIVSFKDGFKDLGQTELIAADLSSPLMPNTSLKPMTLSSPTRVLKDNRSHKLSIMVSIASSEMDNSGYIHKTVTLDYYPPKPKKEIPEEERSIKTETSTEPLHNLPPLKKQEGESSELGSL